MTCAERKDLLFLYAAGALESGEGEALRAHLASGCPTCAGSLAEAQAALGQMAQTVPPIEAPGGALEKLMTRIASDGSSEMKRAPSPFRIAFLSSLAAAAAAVAITSGVILYQTRDARTFWQSRNMNIATLTSDTQPVASGQVWWDKDTRQWRVTVVNLAPPPPGQEYELWFIPHGGKPMPSKTFVVNKNGSATIMVDVPEEVGPLAVAAITNEPIGGVSAPTGSVHLKGQFPDLTK